jgi:uncharacterized protein involved in exopolysaccharide biosynthesis
MKDHGILRFKHNNGNGFINYITVDGKIVTMTTGDSGKAAYVNETGKLNINFKKIGGQFEEKRVKLLDSEEVVNKVFDEMLDQKNTHFKTKVDHLVVLEFE